MKTQSPPAAFYCPESYNPEDSMGYLMRQILGTVAHDVERQLAHTDLTNAQWVPLYKLYIGSATTVAELARQSNLDAGAMTRLLDRLEAKNLCKRVRSEEDRRVVNITLTEAATGTNPYFIATYPGSGAVDAGAEVAVPVTFAPAD